LFARVLPDAPFAAAAAECRRTLCMVDTAGQAEAVILGGNGFVQNAQPRDIARGAWPTRTSPCSTRR
jgi:hypothetical protein